MALEDRGPSPELLLNGSLPPGRLVLSFLKHLLF